MHTTSLLQSRNKSRFRQVFVVETRAFVFPYFIINQRVAPKVVTSSCRDQLLNNFRETKIAVSARPCHQLVLFSPTVKVILTLT